MNQVVPRPSGHRTPWRAMLYGASACALTLVGGCGAGNEEQFDYLELLPAVEQLSEFPLGRYVVPIPVVEENSEQPRPPRNRVQLEFTLQALIPPADEGLLNEAWQQHEGTIRDQIIRTCRHASLDDLAERDLATLKTDLLEATIPLLGREHVRTLTISNIHLREL